MKAILKPAERIMVALDVDEIDKAREIISSISDLGVAFKIGNQLGTYEGWKKVIEFANEFDAVVFCDTKFKDIPETMKKSSRAISRHEPNFFDIMADNNNAALVAAVEGAVSAQLDYNVPMPAILGVTVLTSLNDEECISIYGADSASKVLQFAIASARAGLDGIVCSPEELKMLASNEETKDLIFVTPGIRPTWAVTGDQQRITTPKQAIENGADYLVIGRPITNPPAEIGTPRDAILKIIEEIS